MTYEPTEDELVARFAAQAHTAATALAADGLPDPVALRHGAERLEALARTLIAAEGSRRIAEAELALREAAEIGKAADWLDSAKVTAGALGQLLADLDD